MLLAGDVGGTKTLLGLFERGRPRPVAHVVHSYATASFARFSDLLDAFARDGRLLRIPEEGENQESVWRTQTARLAATEYGADWVAMPNRITLFRLPLEEDFPDPDDLAAEVRITVIHELAHHLGIDDARLDELGVD